MAEVKKSRALSKRRINPFRPGSIAAPGMFAGRLEEVVALTGHLLQTRGGNPQHFLLSGERGIGKSSLLLYTKVAASEGLRVIREDANKFAVIEIELDANCSYSQLIRMIAAGLRAALAPLDKVKDGLKVVWDFVKRIEAAGVKLAAGDPRLDHEVLDDIVSAFVSASKSLSDQLDGILVLIDEADKAPVEAQLGTFCKLFTERLAKQGCDNVCLGLAGVTGIVAKLRASHESAPRIFTVMELRPLEHNERQEVVVKGLSVANAQCTVQVTVAQKALELIATLSEGYPHFIQQFAYSAFEADIDNLIDEEDVLRGANSENGALDQLGQKYFQQMYFEKIGSDEYRTVLQAMASSGDSDGWITKSALRRETKLKDTTLGNAIYALKDRGVIVPKLGESGIYRLPTRSFAAWIRAKQTSALRTRQ